MNQLTGGTVSPYMAIVFMRAYDRMRALFSLDADDGCEPGSRDTWVQAFTHFTKKITLKWNIATRRKMTVAPGARSGSACEAGDDTFPGPRLLLKSPVHTARIRLILSLFPSAKFIYIHRNPVEVIESAVHMANTYYWYSALQVPDDHSTSHFILDQFSLLTRTYLRDRALIPKGNLVEVSFKNLESDPVSTLRAVYASLGLGETDFDVQMRPRLEEYIASNNLENFRKNAHVPLDQSVVEQVRALCPEAFAAFGYDDP